MGAPFRTPIDPDALRQRMESAIERLLDALDKLDAPDEYLEHGADDEDEEDEPSLGAFEHINQGATWLTADGDIDTELEDCDDEEGHDAEAVNEDGDVLDAGELDDSDNG